MTTTLLLPMNDAISSPLCRAPHPRNLLTLMATLVVAAAGLAACATPGSSPAPLALRTAAQAGLAGATQPDDALPVAPAVPVAADWSLGDATLARLIEQALSDNPGLQAAQARVARAQALAGMTEAAHGPQVTLGLDLARQRYTENGLVPQPVAGNIYNSGTLQAGASWSPDFFGQHHAELASALGQAKAAQAEGVAAAQVLATQIGRSHVALARTLAQQDWLARSVALRQQALALVKQRLAAGLDTGTELAQAEGAVRELQSQQASLDEQAQLLRHQLAVLCGQAPQALAQHAPRLDGLNLARLPAELGADLLGRRPDVVAARWRVQASGEDVASARAQFYPNINLSAFVGLNALGLDKLLDTGSRQWGVAPALRLPLFDGGRLRAQLGSRQAERDVAVAQYNALVLDAVREATDTLTSLNALARQQTEQQAVLASQQTQRDLAERRYGAGLGGRLAVLNAELQWVAQQRQLTELQARQLDLGVSLVKALGGRYTEAAPAVALASPAAAP